MANTIHVDVVSAEESIFSGEARFVALPGEAGELGVYPRHTPLITRIKPGSVRIEMADGSEEFVFVAGGILERFFGCRLGRVGLLVVQVLATDGGVRQHGHAVGLHFQNATGHENELFATVSHFDAHRARLNAGDQRGVAGVDAQLASFAGQSDKARFTREDGLFGTDHINVDGVHHCS